MQTLFFRNRFVIGVLMVCVLALGVQGIADAITEISITTSETQYLTAPIEVTNGVFSIAVAVTLQARLTKNSNYQMIPADHAAVSGVQGTYYYDASKYKLLKTDTGDLSVLTFRYRISEANAFYYNEEAITISGSSGITFYGSVQGSSVTLKETETGSKQLTGSITLTGYATTVGTKTITITDATPSADLKSTDTKAETLTHKIYVVQALPTIPPDISLKGITNGFKSRVYGNNDVPIHDRNSPSNYKVTYEVTKGSGTLYLQEGEIESTPRAATLTTSTAAKVFLDANGSGATEDYSDGETHTVTATIDSTVSNGTNTIGVYIYGQPTVTSPELAGVGSAATPGSPGQRISDAFTVTVMDGANPAVMVQSVRVKFEVKDKTDAGGTLINANSGTIVDSNNRLKTDADGIRLTEETGKKLYVRTGTDGMATVDFLLGDAGEQKVFVSAVGMPRKELSAFTTSIKAGKELSNPTSQSSEGKYNLYVTVKEENEEVNDWNVEFRTSKGTLTNTPTSPETTATPNDNDPDNDVAATMTRVVDRTDARGIAWVIYDPKGSTGDLIVTASVFENDSGTGDIIDDVTFNIRGAPRQQQQQQQQQPANIITLSASSTSGTLGDEITLTVSNPAGISVTLSSPDSGFPQSNFSPATGTGTSFTSTVTLPSTAGSYTILASGTIGGRTISDSVTATVTAPGTISLALVGTENNGAHTLQTTVRNAAGTLETTSVTVTLSGAGISRTVTVRGSQSVPITLPATAGILTARATGYNAGTLTIPARTTGSGQPSGDTPPTGSAGVAERIEIDGSRSIDGTVNRSTRLRAQVLDANDTGVRDVRVTFRILAPGRGRLSQRGNGRAVQVNTDRNGTASATLTPLGGNLIVEAKAAGVTAPVSFIIDVGEGSDDTEIDDSTVVKAYHVGDKIPISLEETLRFTGSRTLSGTTYTCVGPGACVISYGLVTKGAIRVPPAKTTTPGTGDTPRTIAPKVLVAAANRPPMLWVDGGSIYALVGKDVQKFVPSVDTAVNIAVGGGKVYWTEMTGESSGTINSANLDGSGATELASILAVPMGIAVDTDTGSKLYWTNSRGRIQSANLDGSKITNVLQDLPGPMDIALNRGIVYWTQYDATKSEGALGIVNPTARGVPKTISTGMDSPGSLVIGGTQVYWTERTGTSSGTINAATLNGSGVAELAAIQAVPMGIAVDGARSQLYWTNARGRVQSANLDGSRIQNVVDGLGAPGDMVLSNSLKETPATPPTSTKSTTTASKSKYDVNGDGTVDVKDSDALIVAVAAGVTDAKYDVTGDGKVDINDVVAVTANRNGSAPGAPALIGNIKLSTVERDRLQEQINLLIATGDRSPAALKTLIYLQQLLVMARPEKTQLLANYPNPFNPETWIPYQLATDTDVRITIYNAQGVVVRTLQLGQQSAGYYTDRDRAAYWDGRNASGEQVASGIYFYQLETDDLSSLRKMVILK